MPLPLPSLLVSGSICPQIKKHNKNTNKTQSFSQTQYTNNYEKYFPTFSSNISIPNGENAHYISKNINKNNEFFSIKPLMTSPHSQVHSEMLSNNLNSTLSIEKLDHVENKFNKVSHSDNLYIKKSSLEQNFELLQKFKDVHGLNSIKPALKEKYRNQELLKVTRSLLIANDSMTKHLKSTNKRILGIETQDLIHYSKYADPNMIKTSIKTDNDNNYPQIQRHFGLEGKFKDEDYENKRFMATKGEWSKVGERKIGSDEVLGLQGHKIKTNFSEGTIKFKEFKVAKMEKIKKNSIKQVNFKKNQQSLTPIAFINKKKEKIEQN